MQFVLNMAIILLPQLSSIPLLIFADQHFITITVLYLAVSTWGGSVGAGAGRHADLACRLPRHVSMFYRNICMRYDTLYVIWYLIHVHYNV
jgi:hypothetical protein